MMPPPGTATTTWTAEVEVRVVVRPAGAMDAAGGGPQHGSSVAAGHGRDCTCAGQLTVDECDRKAALIWMLINQRAELARQLARRPLPTPGAGALVSPPAGTAWPPTGWRSAGRHDRRAAPA